jgi:drug/metabolite transporter (DMT)-like permease
VRTGPPRALPTLALIGVTASWGSTFFMIKDLLAQISVLDFLALRFAIAGAVAFAIAHRSVFRLSRAELTRAIVLGTVYGSAQVLQTVGLSQTAASVSGFVTGLYVVATPLIAAGVLHQRIRLSVWFAVVLSATGLGVLALNGLSVSGGVALIFVSAMLYAVHIVGLGQWSKPANAVGLSVVQLLVIGAICLLVTAPNGMGSPRTTSGWSALIYMALVPGALALFAQTWAQAHLTATRTAVIMTMEPVFAALFAVLFGGESLTVRMLAGGALVLTAMYLVELGPRGSPPDVEIDEQPDRSAAQPHLPL